MKNFSILKCAVCLIILFAGLSVSKVNAQQTGKIIGKVTDKAFNEPLVGLAVSIKGSSKVAPTNVEGRYGFKLAPGKYTLVFQYISYQTKTVTDVEVRAGQVTELNVVMNDAATALKEVVVTSSAKKESTNSLIQFQKNTNSIAQVVSAESIKKSPDKNTGEVLKRVSGASLQDGKYLVVRGLADRYNQASVNGALMPSTEPDRKTFSFDIFPSAIVDNIVINKAATPEMSGEFSGGMVQLNTKDVPDKNYFQVSFGSGTNTQLLNNVFYTYKGGKLDFLGIDDGTRKLPASFPTTQVLKGGSVADNAIAGSELQDIWNYAHSTKHANINFQGNGGFSKSIGNGSDVLGGIFLLSYNAQSHFGDIKRNSYDLQNIVQFDNHDNQYSTNVAVGGLANLSYKSGNNKFSWKNSYNINSTDQVTTRIGKEFSGDITANIKSEELSFTSNRLLSSQFIGDHFLPANGIKLKWNLNYSLLNQDVPDLRRLKYTMDNNGNYYANITPSSGNPRNAGRFYSKLNDNIYGAGTDVSKSFKLFGLSQQLKVGGVFQRKDRTFDARGLSVSVAPGAEGNQLIYTGPDQILDKGNYGETKFYLIDLTANSDSYTAYSNLGAGYLQLDNQLGAKFKLVWGARLESFQQYLKSKNLHAIDVAATDILPSANLIFKQSEKVNIRLSASQTVSRPEFREISPFSFYDYARNGALTGNPDLKRTKITNLDLRYEIYPKAGELFTVGLFYKFFDKPIEMTYDIAQGSPTFGYWNAKSATNYGVEFDIRKRLEFFASKFLADFTVFSNVSLIKSSIAVPDGYIGEVSRPMQGQSPYVVNAGLQYDNNHSGTNASVLYNIIGRRISQVGNSDVPQVWEAPRPLLDFQLSQHINKKAALKFSVIDILAQKSVFYWDQNNIGKYTIGKNQPINQFQSGTGFSLQFNYSF
ncbi:TonB-dependent receptor [Solitalea koreensis]|uniref:Outer membrane receptor proteins, mostly Fe transport n=1 Tax=Solitalea koreensis TaxID=543615 RepID=A0A521DTG0_9SPHI|nr:TonB-dependent receptor [Solitalea koreensis]SMO74915.1 Outer membrane receptor proteins, mostly Fe transport [Solitalea koreensis]